MNRQVLPVCSFLCKAAVIDAMSRKIALVGNPNCGKTTLFNALTKMHAQVGNWPGVTVEKRTGRLAADADTQIIDLPGIYSMTAFSLEEKLTCGFIGEEQADLIVNVVDAAALERSLFLTLQLTETGVPMVLALNKIDEAKRRGYIIDVRRLEKRLCVPIIPICAQSGEGIAELIAAAGSSGGAAPCRAAIYSEKTERMLRSVEDALVGVRQKRLAAVRFVDDPTTLGGENIRLREKMDKIVQNALPRGTERDMLITAEKYAFLSRLTDACVIRRKSKSGSSDTLDRLFTSKIAAYPLFFAIMAAVFALSFGPLTAAASDALGRLFTDTLAALIGDGLTYIGAALPLRLLICDGLIGGLGAVLSFIPQLAVLFLCLTFLEDSGYMTRVAFIMDAPMRQFGLSGRSFISMLMGFGCTVTALGSAKTLPDELSRRRTLFVVPFMSCSARLPVYAAVFSSVGLGAAAILLIYLIGIAVGLLSVRIVSCRAGGDEAPFVMEMTDFRLPQARILIMRTFQKLKGFVVKIGTVLLVAMTVIWVLQHVDMKLHYTDSMNQSLFCTVGAWFAPILSPLGFGDRRIAGALASGIVAKEAIIGTFGALGIDHAVCFTRPSALSFACFVLLYCPCVAAIGALIRESGSKKRAAAMLMYYLLAAWVTAFLVYHAAVFIGL